MSNQKEVITLIKAIAGQANILTIPRIFIDLTGDIKSALFLSQCLYWSDKSSDEEGYFYKSYREWEQEICLTRREVDRSRKVIERVLTTKRKRAKGSPTLHYKIDMAALQKWILTNGIVQNVQNEMYESAKTLTETTTETTSRESSQSASNNSLYPLARALAEVTGLSFEVNKGRLFRDAKVLAKDDRVTPAKIKKDYSRGGAYYKHDWRGQKGDRPSLGVIRETVCMWDEQEETITVNLKER